MNRNYGDVINRALELEAANPSARAACKQRYDEAVETLGAEIIAEQRTLAKATTVVTSEMDDITELSEGKMRPVLDKVRYDVTGYLEEQLAPTRQQTAMRTRLVGLGAIAAILLVVAGAVALRQYNAVPITAALDTRPGIEQRAAALAKVIRYDDWDPFVGGGAPKFVVKLAIWPFEPSDGEIQGAREFAGAVVNAAEQLQAAGQACKLPRFSDPVTEDQVAFLAKISARLRSKAVTWGNPPAATVLNAIRESYPCR